MVRTVFVAPNAQSQGVGKLLMAEVERAARERNIPLVAAEAFYPGLGSTSCSTTTMVMNARSSWSDHSMTPCRSGFGSLAVVMCADAEVRFSLQCKPHRSSSGCTHLYGAISRCSVNLIMRTGGLYRRVLHNRHQNGSSGFQTACREPCG